MYRIGCCLPGGSFMPQGEATVTDSYTALRVGAEFVLSCGFDYVESTVGRIMELKEEELQRAVESGLRIEVCNSFIPPELSIMQGAEGLEAFVRESMRRMHLLGCDTVVLGSGGARKIPDGMSAEEADAAFLRFLQICETYGEKEQITVALEPLNRQECNFMNLVSEGYAIVRKANLPQIRLLADAYHMGKEEESFAVLEDVSDALCHVHVAENIVRSCPGSVPGDDFLPSFSQALQKAGYAGRVTVECRFDDFEREAAESAKYMRRYF